MEQTRRVSRYELIRPVPDGMGAPAFKAWDPYFERYVALKTIPADRFFDVAFRKQFRSRHQAAAQLDHPNIVQTYDWVEEDGSAYQVLEFLEGAILRDRMDLDARSRSEMTNTPLMALDYKVRIAIALLKGLETAHRSHIVHGELNPRTIFLPDHGEAKILDLDLVPAVASEAWTTDAADALVYRAPERFSDATVDARADIWSCGVILYELVTGRKPFSPASGESIVEQIRYTEPRAIAGPEIPAELDRIVARALAKAPAERYGSATEMAKELSVLLDALTAPVATRAEENLLEVAENMLARLEGRKELLHGRLLEGLIDPDDAIDNQLAAILLLEMPDAKTLVDLYPSRLEQVYDRLLELFDHATRVQTLLVQIESYEEADELEQALRAADQLAQEFPRLDLARELKRALQAKLVATSTPERLVAVAETFHGLGRFELARDLLDGALGDQRASEQAQALYQRVIDSLSARDLELDEALACAQGLERSGRLEEALGLAREAVREHPDRVAARRLVSSLETKLADKRREVQIIKSFDKAQLFRDMGDPEKALSAAREVLALDPAHAEARELENSVELELEEKRRRASRRGFEERNRVLAQKATAAFERDDLEEALSYARDVSSSSESHAEASRIIARVELRKKSKERLEAAREAFDAGEILVAESAIKEIVAADPDFVEASVFEDVVAAATARRVAEHYVDRTLRAAASAARRRHYGDAVALTNQVLEKYPRHRTARSLKRRFTQAQQRIESLLHQAHSYLNASRPDIAIRRLNELIALDPDNAEAEELRARAEEKLSLRTTRGKYLFIRKHVRRRPRTAAGIAVALVGLLGVGIFMLVRDAPESEPPVPVAAIPSGIGYAWIEVAPWAEYVWIRKEDGTTPRAPERKVTPMRLVLQSGEYRMELRNHLDPGRPLTVTFTVMPGETVEVFGRLSGFDETQIPFDF